MISIHLILSSSYSKVSEKVHLLAKYHFYQMIQPERFIKAIYVSLIIGEYYGREYRSPRDKSKSEVSIQHMDSGYGGSH